MTKKEDFKHDPIREYIVKAISLSKEYKNKIFQISLGIVVVLFVAYWWILQSEQKQEDATTAFGIALNSYIEAGTDSLKKSIALAKFQEVVDEFNGSQSGDFSKFYLAKEQFDKKNYEEATVLLDEIKSSVDDDVLKAYIMNMLGNIASNNGQTEDAIQYYLLASQLVEVNTLSDNFKVNAMRAYISNNQFNEAIEIAETLLEKENLKYTVKNEVEMLLAKAEFHLF